MKIIVGQQLPTDLGTLRRFVNKATDLVDADVDSRVTYYDGELRISSTPDDYGSER